MIFINDIKEQPIVISGFPGIGKSWLAKNSKDITIYDSDSSDFAWLEPGVRNPDFPYNYINYIDSLLDKKNSIILVSSHKEVRDALRRCGINYFVFYPDRRSKDIYMDRYLRRGSDKNFIEKMDKSFYDFIKDIESDKFPIKIKMKGDAYLSEYIDIHENMVLIYEELFTFNTKNSTISTF